MRAFSIGGVLGIAIDCLIHAATDMRYYLPESLIVGVFVGMIVYLIEARKL